MRCGRIGIAAHTLRPELGVVIYDEHKVVYAVIGKRDIKVKGCPFSGNHLHTSAEHQVGGRDGHPILGVVESRLARVDEIHVVVAGFGVAVVIERDPGDGACPADFRRGVDLLRQTVIVVGIARQVLISGRAGADFHQIGSGGPGGEAHLVAPMAGAVRATVGTDFHRVGGP